MQRRKNITRPTTALRQYRSFANRLLWNVDLLTPCLALPRKVKQDNEFNALRNCLGKKRLIVFQGVSEWLPKPERGETPINLRRPNIEMIK